MCDFSYRFCFYILYASPLNKALKAIFHLLPVIMKKVIIKTKIKNITKIILQGNTQKVKTGGSNGRLAVP